MLKRFITGVVSLPIVIILLYIGGFPLVLLCTAAAAVGLFELYKAISGKIQRVHQLGHVFTGAYFLVLYYFGFGIEIFIALTIFVLLVQVWFVLFFNKVTIKDVITTLYGFFYIPFLLGFIILVREHEMGQYYVWLVATAAFGCDTFAYLTGVTIGKHKLTGTPSPTKSVEGLIGGILGAALVGFVYGFLAAQFLSPPEGFVVHATVISAVAAVFCVFGDMAASAIKRNTGIKDFGALFPGHGGVLDRIDSVLFAAPVVFISLFVLGLVG